ncbi:DUF4176 domain-containing protein [Leifsonia xyli]|uniref:DUF4176 domain-containing protein n=1 Tax=Leifsonia xyli TaxID=1575 RepID=UPI003D66868F
MSKSPELLPLGSAVKMEDDDRIYIVIARGFQKLEKGFLAGYKGVQHPLGAIPDAKEVVIRQPQIAEVVHRGYENPDDAVFAQKQLEVAKVPPAKQPPLPEPDLTIDLSKPVPPASAAPQTTGLAAPAAGVSNPKDPFSELRSRGKKK